MNFLTLAMLLFCKYSICIQMNVLYSAAHGRANLGKVGSAVYISAMKGRDFHSDLQRKAIYLYSPTVQFLINANRL